jgi:hypothetical protein
MRNILLNLPDVIVFSASLTYINREGRFFHKDQFLAGLDETDRPFYEKVSPSEGKIFLFNSILTVLAVLLSLRMCVCPCHNHTSCVLCQMCVDDFR